MFYNFIRYFFFWFSFFHIKTIILYRTIYVHFFLKKFRDSINFAYSLLGKKNFYRNKTENKSKIFRRSIFAVKDIKKGEIFSKLNIKRIRPNYGLPPVYFEKILGKKSPKNIKKENPIRYDVLKDLKIKKIKI